VYVVTFREKPDSLPIVVHNPFTDGLKLVTGSINQGVNNIDSFDFEIDYSNVGYNHIKPMQTLVEVRNIKNNYLEFSGRLLNYADSMGTDGVHTKVAICEGVLGYLHDSHQPYIDYSGTPEDLFIQLITNHNNQVELYKRFTLGTVSLRTKLNKDGTVISVDNSLTIANTTSFITPEQTTYEQFKTNLLDVYGGEIQIRSVGSIHYIDYVQSIGHDSPEDIAISRNLRSVTKKVDPSSIITRLIPLGKTISTEAQNDNEKRTTIESVNGGLLYVERQDLVDEFGYQTGSETWDDINDPTALKNKGIDWLINQKIVLQQFTVEALDLFKIGKGVEEYIVGNTHNVVNPIMTLNERIRIVTKKVDIVEPVNSSMTIGDKFKTLIDYQKEQRDVSKNYSKLQSLVSQQRATINGLSTELENVQNTLTNTSVETLPSDLLAINNQLEAIQNEINDLPVYDLATQTTDGLMSAADKTKLDGMTGGGGGSSSINKYTTTIGDDVSTAYVITHNLGNRDVVVMTRGTVTPYAAGQVDIEYTTINTITIRTPSPIPSTEKLSVTIIG